jgi:hypothetical protein
MKTGCDICYDYTKCKIYRTKFAQSFFDSDTVVALCPKCLDQIEYEQRMIEDTEDA